MTQQGSNGNPFHALGKTAREFERLDIFGLPLSVGRVTYESDEVTALCPVTGQPDYYVVNISLVGDSGLESKSLKLYLGQYRGRGIMCEGLAHAILTDIVEAADPDELVVRVQQKPRGGISILAEAAYARDDEDDEEPPVPARFAETGA